MTPKSLLAPARLARRPILATQSDGRLVDLVRAGFEPAFETIVARYRRPLLHYVSGILPPERAEDAVQQAFVNAYDAMLRDESELSLRPWLYRIAHNVAVNGLRDRGLRHDPLHEELDGVERPDQALERRQGLREVVAAVQALPERQRDAIVLRELEGRSYDEIAGELGVTNGAVRQLLNRARTNLRAAATAVMPIGVLSRVPWAGPAEPVAARVAELCGAAGAGAGAVAAKACATALVTGAVVGGVAVAPNGGDGDRPRPVVPEEAQAARGASVEPVGSSRASGDGGAVKSGADDTRSGQGGDERARSGDERARDGERGERGGPGGGDAGAGGGGDRDEGGDGRRGRHDDDHDEDGGGRGRPDDDRDGRRSGEREGRGGSGDEQDDDRDSARRSDDEDHGASGRGGEADNDGERDSENGGDGSGDGGPGSDGDEEPGGGSSGSEATAEEASHDTGAELVEPDGAGSEALGPAGSTAGSGVAGEQ